MHLKPLDGFLWGILDTYLVVCMNIFKIFVCALTSIEMFWRKLMMGKVVLL